MNKNIIRIVAAACFVPLLVTNIQTLLLLHTFDVFMMRPSGAEILSFAIRILPAIMHLLIIAGVLFQAPKVLAAGAVVMTIQNIISLIASWTMIMNLHNYGSAIAQILTILSYSALALAVFIPKRGKWFGIIAAVLSVSKVIAYTVFNVKLASPLGSHINSVCFAIGSVLIGIIMAERAKQKPTEYRS